MVAFMVGAGDCAQIVAAISPADKTAKLHLIPPLILAVSVRAAQIAKPISANCDHCRSDTEWLPPVCPRVLRKPVDELVVADPHNNGGAN